jgi:cytochrome c1
MNTFRIIIFLTILLLPLSASASEVELPYTTIDLSPEAIERGKTVYISHCLVCHGLKYWRNKEHPDGLKAFLDPAMAEESFGLVPMDLSLVTKARGRRLNGALYIYQLLTTYHVDESGVYNKNLALARLTHTDGSIAMPPPIPPNDPELENKARDVAAFLYDVAEPTAGERKRLGRYVLLYMVILTGLLYALNKKVWEGVKK